MLEIKSKLNFLEAVGDAVVPKGAAVAVLEGCSVVIFGACADTAGALCPACYLVWQKRSCKSLEKSQRDD